MDVLPERLFTQVEYLMVEDKAEIKSQYVAGKLFSMGGEQPWNAGIAGNILCVLHGMFRPWLDHHVYSSGIRVRVTKGELLTYPDVSALCGEPQFEYLANSANLLNPQVIFEVLSPTTEAFDRGDKFSRYQQLESLVDYVLVSSEQMRVEHFVRQGDGSWQYKEYHWPDDGLPLDSVGCGLPLAEIYERVTFPDSITR